MAIHPPSYYESQKKASSSSSKSAAKVSGKPLGTSIAYKDKGSTSPTKKKDEKKKSGVSKVYKQMSLDKSR